MSKVAKHLPQIIIWTILVIILVKRVPGFIEHYKMQSQIAPALNLNLIDGSPFNSDNFNNKLVVVFWATWCGPCKVELSRINKMIQNNEISAQSVLAVSIGENIETVQNFSKEQGYLFLIATDTSGALAESFKVRATPTIVFIDEAKKITWLSSGLSPTLGLRLNLFLD